MVYKQQPQDAEFRRTCPPPEEGEPLAAELARRLGFLELSPQDAQRLQSLAGEFQSHAAEFVESFYLRLFAFDETSSFLQDTELVRRLKITQRDYFLQMLRARWDELYVHQRRAVGKAHAEVGIEPQWFLGAYNLYIQFWVQKFAKTAPPDERVHLEQLSSIFKAVLLDVGLTLDRYFLESTNELRRALALYWKANEELRQFAQITSHDLKTPLATVANLCEETLDEFGQSMPVEAGQLIASAKDRAYRMSTTIDELLASAIQSSEVESNRPISSAACVQQAVEQLNHLIRMNAIELHVDDDLPRIVGNPVRFREVIYNLLSNAVNYMDKPNGRISVTATVTATVNGPTCVFCVADNGPGIPREEQLRIFAPFRRLREHRAIPGSGVGLYFAKTMVEQQGGRMWVESEPGQGSRFFVAMPAVAEGL